MGVLGLVLLTACSSGDEDVRTTESTQGDEVEAVFHYASDVEPGEVDEAVRIMRERLDAMAIDDVEIISDEDGVVRVRMGPGSGIEDPQDALELVGRSAELRFRPVLADLGTAADPVPDLELTDPADDLAAVTVILAGSDGATYQLGPTELTGSIIESAQAQLSPDGAWGVALVLEAGAGIDAFNELAGTCSPPSDTCPTGQLAIVLDSEVASAPTLQSPSFERDAIQISGDFSEQEAKDLALVLRYGSLPVALDLVSVGAP